MEVWKSTTQELAKVCRSTLLITDQSQEAEMIWFVCIAYSSRWVNIGIAMKKGCGGYFAWLKELTGIT